jgi:beta-glucosidase
MRKSYEEEGKRSMAETAKKRKKLPVVIGVTAVILAAILVYGFVITKSGYWLIAKFKPDTVEQKASFTSAADTTRAISDEGFVLMQNNDNLLPLKTSADSKMNINVFGMRGVQLVYNAGGSSASNVESATKLEDSLAGPKGNFNVNEDLLYLYYNYYKNGKISIEETVAPVNSSASEFIEKPSNITVPEVPVSAYTDTTLYSDGKTILDKAKEFSDTAVIVIGRGGGEVFDFTVEQLQLLPDEEAMVDAVAKKFDKVILVVNSANAMELDFVKDYPSIKSIVWIGYPGQSGIDSLSGILNGTVNPSGRLADTWLKDNLANPTSNNYLEREADGTWNKNSYHYTNAPENNGFFTNYSEGIYVGYKYFETRAMTDSAFKYDDAVMFPFGHGLSFSKFEKEIMAINEEDGKLTVRVSVKNTGTVAGKDVVQIYYNPPYTGAIEKATVNLVDFKKTNVIAPGATEYYSITFPIEDMASYDYKVNKSYMLEKGDYSIMLRENAHVELDSEIFTLNDEIIYNEANDGKRSTDLVAATNLFDDAIGIDDYLTRAWDPASRAFTGPKAADYTATDKILAAMKYTAPTDAELGLKASDIPEYGKTLAKQIDFSEMVGLEYDDPKWDEFVSQLTLKEMSVLAGTGTWQIAGIDRLGVPRTLTPDGTTTIGASIYSGAIMGADGKGVTYPTPVVIASTWNVDIANLMGTSVGNEGKANGYSGWYAPAMNTHRSPFNGRNFEYYSEDGLLAGKIAANVVKGAKDQGMITFMKHFALNERESNVRNFMFSWSNEQAIREIYLKPFEMAVKEGGTLGAMSSFNFIGYSWAGGNSNLLTGVLRNEWGFKGLVITDANIYPHMNPIAMLNAGGNLSLDVMGAWTGKNGHNEVMLKATEDPAIKISVIKNLYESSKHMLYAVSNTWKAQK